MKAIKIDVLKQDVEYVELSKDYKDISKEIGCDYFCCPVTFENQDTIYCDDEALLNPDNIQGGFIFSGWNYPLINNAIILGTDEEGASINCKSTIEDIKSKIHFVSKQTILFFKTYNNN